MSKPHKWISRQVLTPMCPYWPIMSLHTLQQLQTMSQSLLSHVASITRLAGLTAVLVTCRVSLMGFVSQSMFSELIRALLLKLLLTAIII